MSEYCSSWASLKDLENIKGDTSKIMRSEERMDKLDSLETSLGTAKVDLASAGDCSVVLEITRRPQKPIWRLSPKSRRKSRSFRGKSRRRGAARLVST
jgi:hypothetical protein